MAITLRQIRYFIATADRGQVSQAATEVNVAQSAITTAIQQLEADLGVSLFTRHNAGLALTLEGTRFLQHARTIMAAVNAAETAPLSTLSSMAGSVKVGVSYTVAGYFLPRHYARFARTYPNIAVEIFEMSRQDRLSTIGGPIMRAIIAFGKFHGVIDAVTPIGCLIVKSLRLGTFVGIVSP